MNAATRGLALCAALWIGGAPIQAASAKAASAKVVPAKAAATKAAHPNFSGFYNLARTNKPLDPAMVALVSPGTPLLDDVGAPEFPRGEYGGLKLKPAARDVAAKWDPRDDMTLSKACSPPSLIYEMQGPFPMQIDQGAELILIRMEYYDQVRVIFMDGRPHLPPDAPHTKMGDSIGHWEGDTLVVDTDHIEAATVTNNGLYHSDKAHVVEHFRLAADGKTLMAIQEFDDPETLDNHGARFIVWKRSVGDYIYPYECDPTFGLNYGAPGSAPAPGAAPATPPPAH